MNRGQYTTKREQIILLTKNIFYNSKHNSWHFFSLTFPWTLFHQPYGGRSWKTDVWLWVLASLIKDLTCCIQPFNDSLKFYFDNLSVNPACRSMFLISDKENMLKPFQQHIISEVERELMWWTLVCFILLAVSSLLFIQHTQNSDIWSKCL